MEIIKSSPNFFVSGAMKTKVLPGQLQKCQHRKVLGGRVSVTETTKGDLFFLTLFKIPQNYHAIAICH